MNQYTSSNGPYYYPQASAVSQEQQDYLSWDAQLMSQITGAALGLQDMYLVQTPPTCALPATTYEEAFTGLYQSATPSPISPYTQPVLCPPNTYQPPTQPPYIAPTPTQRHSYPPALIPQQHVSQQRPVAPSRRASSSPSSSSPPAQFGVMAPSGRTLSSNSNFKVAMRVARSMQRGDGVNPADDTRVCPHCNKVCDRPSTLRTHLNSHTGVRPHTCTVPGCGRQFTVLSNMYRHAKNCSAQRDREARASGYPVLLSAPGSSYH